MKLAAVRAVDLVPHRPDSLSLSAVWLSTGKKNANCPQEQLSIAIWSEVPEADKGPHPHCPLSPHSSATIRGHFIQ